MTRSRNDAADVAVVARCGQGDARALEELYERYAGSCLALARSVLGDPHHAEDAVREAFLDLWRNAQRFDPGQSSARAWLHLLTHRKAVDRLRSDQPPKSFALLSGNDRQEERHAPAAARAIGSLVATRTRQALAALPAADREALVLAYWAGYSQREISTLTSTPLETIKTRMHRAMRDLRLIARDEARAGERLPDSRAQQPVAGNGRPRPVRDLPR